MRTFKLVALAALTPLLLAGCSSLDRVANAWTEMYQGWQGTEVEGVEFVSKVPPGISQAWVHGDDLWIVPKKGTAIKDIASEDWQKVRWAKVGEYARVRLPPMELRVKVGDGWQPLNLDRPVRR